MLIMEVMNIQAFIGYQFLRKICILIDIILKEINKTCQELETSNQKIIVKTNYH